MKKITLNLLALFVASIFSTGCSTGDIDEETINLDVKANVFEGQNIEQNQLVGTWNLFAMNANIAVDLNLDGDTNVNLLEETTCFDEMYFSFDNRGILQTQQGRISISDESLTCDGIGVYITAYEVKGNNLTITMDINGEPFSFTKKIGLSQDASGDYLHVEVTEYEVEEFLNDPGNTVASEIKALELVFVKQ